MVKIISVVDQYSIGKCSIMRKRIFGFPNFFMSENAKKWPKLGQTKGWKKSMCPPLPPIFDEIPWNIIKNVSEFEIILMSFFDFGHILGF